MHHATPVLTRTKFSLPGQSFPGKLCEPARLKDMPEGSDGTAAEDCVRGVPLCETIMILSPRGGLAMVAPGPGH